MNIYEHWGTNLAQVYGTDYFPEGIDPQNILVCELFSQAFCISGRN